jgi:hypothetical protein
MYSKDFVQKIEKVMDKLTADELELFEADIADAIDGVIEDWEGK